MGQTIKSTSTEIRILKTDYQSPYELAKSFKDNRLFVNQLLQTGHTLIKAEDTIFFSKPTEWELAGVPGAPMNFFLTEKEIESMMSPIEYPL